MLRITIDTYTFRARLETERAPRTCAAFRTMLPLRTQVIHVRWSGEAIWMPFGAARLGVDYENNTSYPAPGEVLLYPGGRSEMEFLIAYGPTAFASKAGQLSGNHFATIVEGLDQLRQLGRRVLWEGAKDVLIQDEGEPGAGAPPRDTP